MKAPLAKNDGVQKSDSALVAASLAGDRKSLGELVARYQPYIYNVAWKMVLNPSDAEDVTQEVLIKVVTSLSKFEGRSQFSTWLYRIVVNHVLTMKKRSMEEPAFAFPEFFSELEKMPDNKLTPAEELELEETIEEVRISCTAGMLLCLQREQRAIFVLGEIFEIDHKTGAEVFGISADNYRQKLSRARKELYNWMNGRCGLVNEANPCRCPKKTRSFVRLGYVDPKSLRFNSDYKKRVKDILSRSRADEEATIEALHRKVFQAHPFKESGNARGVLELILNNPAVKSLYSI